MHIVKLALTCLIFDVDLTFNSYKSKYEYFLAKDSAMKNFIVLISKKILTTNQNTDACTYMCILLRKIFLLFSLKVSQTGLLLDVRCLLVVWYNEYSNKCKCSNSYLTVFEDTYDRSSICPDKSCMKSILLCRESR